MRQAITSWILAATLIVALCASSGAQEDNGAPCINNVSAECLSHQAYILFLKDPTAELAKDLTRLTFSLSKTGQNESVLRFTSAARASLGEGSSFSQILKFAAEGYLHSGRIDLSTQFIASLESWELVNAINFWIDVAIAFGQPDRTMSLLRLRDEAENRDRSSTVRALGFATIQLRLWNHHSVRAAELVKNLRVGDLSQCATLRPVVLTAAQGAIDNLSTRSVYPIDAFASLATKMYECFLNANALGSTKDGFYFSFSLLRLAANPEQAPIRIHRYDVLQNLLSTEFLGDRPRHTSAWLDPAVISGLPSDRARNVVLEFLNSTICCEMLPHQTVINLRRSLAADDRKAVLVPIASLLSTRTGENREVVDSLLAVLAVNLAIEGEFELLPNLLSNQLQQGTHLLERLPNACANDARYDLFRLVARTLAFWGHTKKGLVIASRIECKSLRAISQLEVAAYAKTPTLRESAVALAYTIEGIRERALTFAGMAELLLRHDHPTFGQ